MQPISRLPCRLLPVVFLALALLGAGPAGAHAQTDAGAAPLPTGCSAPVPDVPPPGLEVLDATVGQPFTISLASNPTTGYRWGLAQPLDETVLHLVHSAYQRGQSGLMGAGGVETWTFLPVCAGVTVLDFAYWRPWEQPAPGDRQARYLIVVQ